MALSLPIPKAKEEKSFFYVPYSMDEGFINKTVSMMVGEADTISTLRRELQENYGIDAGSFAVGHTHANEIKKLSSQSVNLLEIANEPGATLLFEIDPALSPSLPTQSAKDDQMYNISQDVTMLQLNIQGWVKSTYNANHLK